MYRFVKEKDFDNVYDKTRVIIEVESVFRDDLVNAFIEFLAASGFDTQDLKDNLK